MFLRGKIWFAQIKCIDGKWRKLSTGHAEEAAAERWVRETQNAIDARRATAGIGPLTVAAFSVPWIAERKALGLDWKNDEQRLRDHVLPVIGHLELNKVRARHLAELFKQLRASGKLAQKTIYTIYSIVAALFRDAEIADLIDRAPAKLTVYQLGPLSDQDSAKKGDAVFAHDEVQQLISDSRLSPVCHMVYALGALSGLRHGEYAGLRWHRYDPTKEPLGQLTIATSYDKGRTKTGAVRRIPVHPTLAAMLAEWRLGGWAAMMGRAPGPDDLIVPLPPDPPKKQARPNPRAGGMRTAKDTGKRWETDLKLLGLRYRKGHDLRATFVTLCEADGADPNVIEKLTHTPKGQSAYGVYSRTQWETYCREVAKLKIQRGQCGSVARLPLAASIETAISPRDSNEFVPALSHGSELIGIAGEKWRSGRDSNPPEIPVGSRRHVAIRAVESHGRVPSGQCKESRGTKLVPLLADDLARAVSEGDLERARKLAQELLAGPAVMPTRR